MAKTPVAEQVQVNFRMPVDLRDQIKSIADANNRSMNAEIILALETWINIGPPPSPEEQERKKVEQMYTAVRQQRDYLAVEEAALSARLKEIVERLERLAPKD